MDIELARTFVEIVSAGSFIKAADRLHAVYAAHSANVDAAMLGVALTILRAVSTPEVK